ncbi:MAG: alpha/beta hydrolase [Clostridiales bacterium]|nr:alpha/beta hydrolase [Clostridiales bacterium]
MTGAKKTITFKSSSGLCDIFAEVYYPEKSGDIKAVIQIAHGMAEHHERYEDFISFLNDNGYAVFINDHLGHGKSVSSDSELGFFGKKAGYIYLVDDMKQLHDMAKEEFPDIPYILFGHSMGSFLARLFCERYGDTVDGAVFCGTSGPNSLASVGLPLIKAIASIKGDHYRSKFIDNMSFGSYNKKINPQRTSFDWLTSREDIIDQYIADPYCGFLFTTCGYRDLVTLIILVNRADWYTSVPSDLPVYIISGDADPVGNYGKGVTEVYRNLIDSNHSNVTMKLYAGDRHEILNEKDNKDVYNDILSWIKTVTDI